MLMGLLHVWDDESESFVGLEELKDERIRQERKEAVRMLRGVGMRANMLKGVVRAMVMASLTTCASALGEGNTTNCAAEYIMAAYVVVFEQFPISSAVLLTFIMVLIVIICMLQGNRQQTVVIHGRDESYAASSCGKSSKRMRVTATTMHQGPLLQRAMDS